MTKLNEKVVRPHISYTEFESMPIWASDKPIPSKGDEVCVNINSVGRSIVMGLFVENGYIGLIVQPTNPPDWYKNQNPSTSDSALYDWGEGHFFPSEILELRKVKV